MSEHGASNAHEDATVERVVEEETEQLADGRTIRFLRWAAAGEESA
ncbi:hypothetical protein EV188_105258 [Actinomycetospora succinea]|uniref:Uncharacterized protein n=1 Tax=Actinomycetospora succinea TaxID=663603 RepID=A0A4V3D9I6_9PSEU|nr:hypothetical protein [Actinomycetospora succinea]TDQ55860.1 hypothetical protein EV188_105258 [Actinomycetospora succinea]